MAWRPSILLAVFGLAVLACGPVSSPSEDAGPADFRNQVFSDPDGDTATLADFGGQPLIINFFATWCAPCRVELPDLEAFHLAGDGEVQLIGISHDLSRSSWLSLVAETSLTFPTYHQPEQEIFTELELFVMPTTILLTAEGELAHTYSGILNEETLRNLVSEHLGLTIPPATTG